MSLESDQTEIRVSAPSPTEIPLPRSQLRRSTRIPSITSNQNDRNDQNDQTRPENIQSSSRIQSNSHTFFVSSDSQESPARRSREQIRRDFELRRQRRAERQALEQETVDVESIPVVISDEDDDDKDNDTNSFQNITVDLSQDIEDNFQAQNQEDNSISEMVRRFSGNVIRRVTRALSLERDERNAPLRNIRSEDLEE